MADPITTAAGALRRNNGASSTSILSQFLAGATAIRPAATSGSEPPLDQPLAISPIAGPASAALATSRPPGTPPTPPDSNFVRLSHGDTLWGIARRELGGSASPADVQARAQTYVRANRLADPRRLRTGEEILTPSGRSNLDAGLVDGERTPPSPPPSPAYRAPNRAPPHSPRGRPQPDVPIYLLGRPLAVTHDVRVGSRRGSAVEALTGGADRLARDRANGLLTDQEAAYLSSLHGFGVGLGRSGQDRGVFTLGVDDLDNTDPAWVASCILHDSVHASLWRRGTNFRDELIPSMVQENYLRRRGLVRYADWVRKFRVEPARQLRRLQQPYSGGH